MRTTDGGLADAVAQRVCSIGSTLPDDTYTAARAHFLDCLGLIIAGRSSGRVRRASAVQGGPDPVVALSLACGALGLDDFDETTRTHPGAMIVPALLVTAAEAPRRVAGNRLANALVLGYEMIAWLGAATDARHMHPRGRHPSAVLGVPSVALAASVLVELDERAVAAAMGIGAAFSFGLTQFDAHEDMRALQTAEGASAGLRAARFAAAGFPAADHALEGAGGYLGGDLSRLLPVEAIGVAPSAIEQVSFKPYPHFSDLHPLVAALLSALDGVTVVIDEVVGVRAFLTDQAASRLHDGPVVTVKDAKRSAAFVLAFALRSTTADRPDLRLPFTEAHVFDPHTQALADQVEVTVTPADTMHESAVAAVEITLADGRILAARSEGYPGDGRDPALRWSFAQARERFDAMVRVEDEHPALAATAVRLVDRLMTSDDVRDDARALIHALVERRRADDD